MKPANTAGPLELETPPRIWLNWLMRLGIALALVWNTPMLAALPVGSVTLDWSPSPSPDIAGYNVLYGVASGIYTHKVSAGNTNSVTLSNLVPGTTYYFVVTGYDTAGDESAPSNEAVYTVPADTVGLPAVLGNAALSAGSFSFNVTSGSGTNFAVEASVDLTHWIRVATNTAPFTFVDIHAGEFAKRFYRTVMLSDLAPSDAIAPPVVLGNPSLSGGSFVFTVPGPTGTNFAVEASEDLIHWIRVQTNTAPFTFVDANAAHFAQRFYRVVVLPDVAPASPVVPSDPLFSGGSHTFTVSGLAGASSAVETFEDSLRRIRAQPHTAPFTFVNTNNADSFARRFHRTVVLP